MNDRFELFRPANWTKQKNTENCLNVSSFSLTKYTKKT